VSGRTGATVTWTRHLRPSDLTPQVRAQLAGCGFAENAFDALESTGLGQRRRPPRFSAIPIAASATAGRAGGNDSFPLRRCGPSGAGTSFDAGGLRLGREVQGW